jgi:hypothetical protein
VSKGKAPAFQFYVRDWLSSPDIQMSAASTRGIWINFLAYMWESRYRGEVEGTKEELCMLGGCSSNELERFFSDARKHNFCDIVTDSHMNITIINRRMSREYNEKLNNRKRQQKHRYKKMQEEVSHKSNADVTPDSNKEITPLSSTSTSTAKINTPKGAFVDEGKSSTPVCPHKEIISLYHKILPAHRKVKVWQGQRENMLRARWKEDPARQKLEWWNDYFHMVRSSPFLCGKTDKGWMPDLEWLIRPNNICKVIEGKFDDKGKAPEEKPVARTQAQKASQERSMLLAKIREEKNATNQIAGNTKRIGEA